MTIMDRFNVDLTESFKQVLKEKVIFRKAPLSIDPLEREESRGENEIAR
jgi:hypothetical protein